MQMISVDDFLIQALKEDLGTGDVTSLACVPQEAMAQGQFIAKEAGVICGLDIAARVFFLLDAGVSFLPKVEDGCKVEKGDVIAQIKGPAQAVLMGERLALNLLQRLSGIATKTAQAVLETVGTKTQICDTRKTTPGMRALEKYAVRIGGGKNHRFGLYDAVMIKDNHIVAAGGIEKAVSAARAYIPHTMKIEVEVSDLAQVQEALAAGADIIMFDNMDNETMALAVTQIDGQAVTEASGNMNERSLKEVCACGVDYISIGALTHSVKSLDISLRFS